MDPSDVPYIIEVGIPGPAGSGGPSASEWNAYKALVDDLYANSYTGKWLTTGYVSNSSLTLPGTTTGGYIGQSVTTPTLDTTKPYRIIALCTTRVTVASGKTVTMRVDLGGSLGFGVETTSPSVAGTWNMKFSGSFDAPAGASTRTVFFWYKTSDATNATLVELDVDLIAIPRIG